MDLLERTKEKIKQIKKEWITPPDEPKQGFVQLRTADGKTTITVSLTNSKDAHKAKQLVNIALQDKESYDVEPYNLGMVDMEGDEIE